MSVKFSMNTGKRMENNFAETKVNLRKNFYVVATDGKKSYITTIEDALLVEARQEAQVWAKQNGLTIEQVRAMK
jgi:hypothetical protein